MNRPTVGLFTWEFEKLTKQKHKGKTGHTNFVYIHVINNVKHAYGHNKITHVNRTCIINNKTIIYMRMNVFCQTLIIVKQTDNWQVI